MKTPTKRKLNIMTTIAYTATQKTSLTDMAKRWQNHLVETIMSDDFDADEDSFRTLFQDTLNFERLELMSDDELTKTNTKTNKRQNRVKKVKDPNAPTKPPTPYILFLWGDKTNPDILGTGKVNALKSEDPQMVHKDAVAQAATAWKNMSVEDKTPYTERNAALKTLYTSAMETYNSDSDNYTTEPEHTFVPSKTTSNEPTTNEPTPNEPTTNEPTTNEPTTNEPTPTEPTPTESTHTESTHTESTHTEPLLKKNKSKNAKSKKTKPSKN